MQLLYTVYADGMLLRWLAASAITLEAGASFSARDVWCHEDLGSFKGQTHFTAAGLGVAPKTSCVAVRLTPAKLTTPKSPLKMDDERG